MCANENWISILLSDFLNNIQIQWTPLIVATSEPALGVLNIRRYFNILMWSLGYDFSGRYNRLAHISVDIISGASCNPYTSGGEI